MQKNVTNFFSLLDYFFFIFWYQSVMLLLYLIISVFLRNYGEYRGLLLYIMANTVVCHNTFLFPAFFRSGIERSRDVFFYLLFLNHLFNFFYDRSLSGVEVSSSIWSFPAKMWGLCVNGILLYFLKGSRKGGDLHRSILYNVRTFGRTL